MPYRMAADDGGEEQDRAQVEPDEHDGRRQNPAHILHRSIRLPQQPGGTMDEGHQDSPERTGARNATRTVRQGACF